jgi:hypothetical protein
MAPGQQNGHEEGGNEGDKLQDGDAMSVVDFHGDWICRLCSLLSFSFFYCNSILDETPQSMAADEGYLSPAPEAQKRVKVETS